MKILLHMGQGKTGTTALQNGLHDAAADLAKAGILYPVLGRRMTAHHVLMALCVEDGAIWHNVLRRYGGAQKARAAAEAALDEIRAQITTFKPHTVVLSSEAFFYALDAAARTKLAGRLAQLGGTVQPIAYIRAPAGLYLARVQEKALVSVNPIQPAAQMLRSPIEQTETAFGPKMALIPYQASTFGRGGIVSDFVTRFLPEFSRLDMLADKRVNTSVSGEASMTIAALRSMVAPNLDWTPHPVTTQLAQVLRRIDSALPEGRKAVLDPALCRAVTQSSTDYLWLRDARGVQFDEIDYEDFDQKALDGFAATTLRLRDILTIDPARHERLLMMALAETLGQGQRAKQPEAVPGPRKIPRRSAFSFAKSVLRGSLSK